MSVAGGRPRTDLRGRRFLALGLLAVAGVFTGVVLGILVGPSVAGRDSLPDSARMETLRRSLDRDGGMDGTRDAIRALDATLRREYLTARRRERMGALLLLAGAVWLLACGRWYAAMDPETPVPVTLRERSDGEGWERSSRRRFRAAAGAAGAVAAGFAAMAVLGVREPSPDARGAPPPASAGPAGAVAADPAGAAVRTAAGFADRWPQFRGPAGAGIAPAGEWPTAWDGPAGRNIEWKTAVPLPGRSSPVVWADRVFLTGSDGARQAVMCFDRATGALLWTREVRPPGGGTGRERPEIFEQTGYAAPTPATDGARVFAFFATADLAALDFSGAVLWARNLGSPSNMYGISASPILVRNRLIVQFDRGFGADEKLSAILALDPATGKELWRTPRPAGASWSTPAVAGNGEIVAAAEPWVMAYDAERGTEIWRAEGIGGDHAASPIVVGDLVFTTSAHTRAMAVRVGGRGDVTKSRVVWTAAEGLSDTASPVSNGVFFLQANSGGTVSCYRVPSGDRPAAAPSAPLWTHVFEGSAFWASPVLAGGRVYLFDEKGVCRIVALGERFEAVSRCILGEPVQASPAFADSRIYVRGESSLFSIGRAP